MKEKLMKISSASMTLRRVVLGVVLTGLSCGAAQAALPWEGPLTQLQTSLTGPVAKAIGVIALAVSGGMLAFGGELSDFTKRIMMVVLALSVMLMADQFMSMFG
jgi:type IV secretory pathway VirB2 component (pilin)